MDLKLCIKISRILWWKPFLNWNLVLRIIMEKLKSKTMDLHACMHACVRLEGDGAERWARGWLVGWVDRGFQ
jgi:hypothetical protein